MCKYKILYRNCGRLIISVIVYLIIPHYLDNRSNSRANICIKAELSGTAVFISIKPSLFGVDLVSHNNLSNCMHMLRQWIIQVSALSARMVVYLTTMAITGHGRLGFDSGEGA